MSTLDLRMATSGERTWTVDLFEVRLEFAKPERRLISETFRVAGGSLPNPMLGLRIGRDVSRAASSIYNGLLSQFTLSY